MKVLTAGIAGPEMANSSITEELRCLSHQQEVAATRAARTAKISAEFESEGRDAMKAHGSPPLTETCRAFPRSVTPWRTEGIGMKVLWRKT
jgi:hypothetical protein